MIPNESNDVYNIKTSIVEIKIYEHRGTFILIVEDSIDSCYATLHEAVKMAETIANETDEVEKATVNILNECMIIEKIINNYSTN